MSGDQIEQAVRVIDDILSADPQVAREMFGDEPDKIARALAEAGLLAPAPLTEEWAARYVNGGGTVCQTRDEATAAMARMVHDSHRLRVDQPPAPEVAGIYVRHVTAWEPVESDEDRAVTPDPLAPAALAEVLDRFDTALAALEDTQTALAEVHAAGTTRDGRDHVRIGLGLARRHLENAHRDAAEALQWLEAVGRDNSRRRHPASRRHG